MSMVPLEVPHYISFILMSRYFGERKEEDKLARTSPFFSTDMPRAFNGGTWDARHMTNFMNRSSYSNWQGDKPNISRISEASHKRSYSTQGDHFFRTTKDNKNESKIGYTPIFPLVSNIQPQKEKEATLSNFFQTSKEEAREKRSVSGREMKLRCSPEDSFKYEANVVKFQSTDPITLKHEEHPSSMVSGYSKERMTRLIQKRHPHGMTGIDHPQNPESKYYQTFQEKVRVRQQPNSRQTFLIDRDWKEKKRSVPPVDDWKERKMITIRRFRNENIHGFNILTNRLLE